MFAYNRDPTCSRHNSGPSPIQRSWNLHYFRTTAPVHWIFSGHVWLLAVLCFLPSSWYRNHWAPSMQSEPTQEGLHLIYYVCRPQEPLTKGKYKRVHGFHGTCIGDCAATVSSEVLRIVAFQVAGRINDIGGWVSDAVLQLQRSGAHVGVFTETRIQTSDRHSPIVKSFKEN